MMVSKCPGQDGRNIDVQTRACASCGYAVEIFSDEVKVRCPRCKNLVCRERLPSCVNWCKVARECIGEEKWNQLRGSGGAAQRVEENQ